MSCHRVPKEVKRSTQSAGIEYKGIPEYSSGTMSSPIDTTKDLIQLSFFTDMARSIASATTLHETLEQVMKHVAEVFAPRNWSLFLRDAKTGELVFAVVTGNSAVRNLKGRRLARGKGIAGWIAEHQEPLIIEDVGSDDRFDASFDEATSFQTRSIIGVPLVSRGNVFGVIELINKLDGEPFTALDLKVLSTIADFAAIAIEKAYYLKALRKVASVDHLTGLLNRRSLARALNRELARCQRSGKTLAVLMIDIDEFKMINDTHGHALGDAVLQHIAGVLQGHIRTADIAARYGGDEFIVLMPDTSLEPASEVKRRIETKVREAIETQPVPYRISVGLYCGCPDDPNEIFHGADLKMYEEKARNREVSIEEIDDHITEFFDEESEDSPPQ